jgi:putative transposase
VSLAAVIAVKTGQWPRLICRVHAAPPRRSAQGFTEPGYARLPTPRTTSSAARSSWSGTNLNTHVSKAMGRLVAARDWLTVFQLPAYASELNPVKSVWALLKRFRANLVKRNLSELTALIKTHLRHMQYRAGLIDGLPRRDQAPPHAPCNLRN